MEPLVSFEVVPSSFSEESENNLVQWVWTVTGEFPEDGIIVNLETSGGNPDIPFDFTNQFAASPEAEFIDADIVGFDEETGDLNILLEAPEASFQLYFADDIIEEGTQVFNFDLVEGEGYVVDPEQSVNEFTITDDNGGPGIGPTVSLSVSETDLAEGDPLTVDFTLDGEIPEGGVQVLVQSPVFGALGQFDLADLSVLELTGIAGVPEVGDGGGGSFLVTITEPTASITTSVFNDIIAEEPLELPFTLANGELYEVDPEASEVALTISDETQPAGPTVGLTVDNTDLFEGDTFTITLDVEGEIPAEGLTVLVNDVTSAQNQLRSLTEFDVGNIELTGISGFPIPAEGDSGFFVTIAEPTATITLPVFDDGADEIEAEEVFTFELIDGEAYEVSPDASSVALNITDVGDTPIGLAEGDGVIASETLSPVVSLSIEPDVVIEEDAGASFTATFTVDGEIPAPEFDADGNVVSGGLSVLLDVKEVNELGPQFDTFDLDGLTFGPGPSDPSLFNLFEFILLEDTSSITVNLFNDIIQEEPFEFNFELIEAGDLIDSEYIVDLEASTDSFTLEDGNGGPGVGPVVGLSVSESELSEGDQLSVNFSVDGEIPEEGLTVLVTSDTPGSIGEFAIFDESGNFLLETAGIAGFPEAADGQGSSFFVTLTEPEASLTLSVFEDGPTEGAESFTFELVDGEIYEVSPDLASASFTINDGGEDAAFAVESGVTSVFLDLPLIEEATGLTLVSADSDATPSERPSFLEPFQVGFAILEDSDFEFAPAPFTPLGETIEHDGTITLGLGGAEVTVGEFSIGFDESRVSDTASGFFVADTLEDPLGLEILFDIGTPGTVGVSGADFGVSGADLLLAPEVATALGLPDLAGADVGDAQIDALVTEI